MPRFDPDLDFPPPRLVSPYGESVREYQRLVVNPLLAVVGLLGTLGLLWYSLHTKNLPSFLLSLVLTAACPFLIQYHCLDCGRTDFTVRSSRHACGETVRRMRLGHEPSFPLPSVRTQIKAWVLTLSVAVLMYAILARPIH